MSAPAKCFNCKEVTDHKSIDCPKSQLYTRCRSCGKVAFDGSGHSEGCQSKSFVSTRNDMRFAEEVENIVNIEFKNRNEVSVVGESGNLIPLPNAKTVLSRSLVISNRDNKICVDGPTNASQTIIIENAARQARVKLVIGTQLDINLRYKICSNGLVKYFPTNFDYVASGSSNCRLHVNENDHCFKVRIEWMSTRYVLDVYPTDTRLSPRQHKGNVGSGT